MMGKKRDKISHHKAKKSDTVSYGVYIKDKRQIILLAGTLLFIGGLVALYLLWGRDFIRTASQERSCSNDQQLISDYNSTVRNNSVTKLGDISSRVKAKDNAKDPTCVYMLMISQYGDNTTIEEETTLDTLKSLETDGKQISEAINDGIDRKDVEAIIKQQREDREKGYDGQG